jgi:hypothetical protein
MTQPICPNFQGSLTAAFTQWPRISHSDPACIQACVRFKPDGNICLKFVSFQTSQSKHRQDNQPNSIPPVWLNNLVLCPQSLYYLYNSHLLNIVGLSDEVFDRIGNSTSPSLVALQIKEAGEVGLRFSWPHCTQPLRNLLQFHGRGICDSRWLKICSSHCGYGIPPHTHTPNAHNFGYPFCHPSASNHRSFGILRRYLPLAFKFCKQVSTLARPKTSKNQWCEVKKQNHAKP